MIVGLGVDLVDIPRVERMVARFGERVLSRLFTDGERRYATERSLPAASLAVRIAAKEATYKALSGNDLARAIGWRDIEVVNAWDGSPSIELHGIAKERAEQLGVSRVLVTLSHTHLGAVAVVVCESGR